MIYFRFKLHTEVEFRHVRVKLYLEYDYDNILDTDGVGDLRADFPIKPSTGELELRLVKEHWNLDNCVVSTGTVPLRGLLWLTSTCPGSPLTQRDSVNSDPNIMIDCHH